MASELQMCATGSIFIVETLTFSDIVTNTIPITNFYLKKMKIFKIDRYDPLYFLVFRSEYTLCTCNCTVGKRQVPFSIAIGNMELKHECFPKNLRMRTVRLK